MAKFQEKVFQTGSKGSGRRLKSQVLHALSALYSTRLCVKQDCPVISPHQKWGLENAPGERGHKGKGKTATSLCVAPVLPVDMAGLSALQKPLLPGL